MDDIPALVSSALTPKIVWFQTDTKVVIRVLLCDVKDYHFGVTDDYFYFTAKVNDKDYFVLVNFYGAINPENTKYINLDREIRIYIEKAHKWLPWLRLQQETERNPMIVADLERIEDADSQKSVGSEENGLGGRGVSFAEYKRMNHITNIPPAGMSDEEYSDDEGTEDIFDCYV